MIRARRIAFSSANDFLAAAGFVNLGEIHGNARSPSER